MKIAIKTLADKQPAAHERSNRDALAMNILNELRQRFADVLKDLAPGGEKYAEIVLPSQDARFGDYQANVAMPLGKLLGRPPRALAGQLVTQLADTDLQAMCEPPKEQ